MVGHLAGDVLGLLAVASHAVVVAGQLESGLDRLAAAAGEEDPVEVARGHRGDLRGELDRPGMGVAPDHEEVEFLVLAGSRFGQFGAAVAGVHAEQPGKPVEVPLAVGVVDIGAVAPGDDRNLMLVVVTAHAGEVHPEVAASLFLQSLD